MFVCSGKEGLAAKHRANNMDYEAFVEMGHMIESATPTMSLAMVADQMACDIEMAASVTLCADTFHQEVWERDAEGVLPTAVISGFQYHPQTRKAGVNVKGALAMPKSIRAAENMVKNRSLRFLPNVPMRMAVGSAVMAADTDIPGLRVFQRKSVVKYDPAVCLAMACGLATRKTPGPTMTGENPLAGKGTADTMRFLMGGRHGTV